MAGEIPHPRNVLTPYGALASDLIGELPQDEENKLKYINGGPMNGNAIDTPSYATLLQTNGVIVMKKENRRAEPCWHCGNCCDSCPMDLQPVQIQMALKKNDLKRMKELHAERCCGCGLCSYICPSRIEVSQNVMKAKAIVLQALKEGK